MTETPKTPETPEAPEPEPSSIDMGDALEDLAADLSETATTDPIHNNVPLQLLPQELAMVKLYQKDLAAYEAIYQGIQERSRILWGTVFLRMGLDPRQVRLEVVNVDTGELAVHPANEAPEQPPTQ